MRFTILTYGSRGDVQPYVALGQGLVRAGHSVTLAAPALFADFVRAHGLEFHPLPGDPTQLMQHLFARSARLGGPLTAARAVLRAVAPAALAMYPAVLAACRGADAVIHSLLLTALGHHAARALNLPDFSALVFALFAPTAAFANPLFPAWRLGPRYNYLTHREFNRVFWHLNRLGTAWLRRKASVAQHALIPVLEEWPFWRGDPYLAEIAGAGCASCSWQTPILYGISPHVLPRPADWDANTHLTGYWFLDTPADYAAPPELERFLADGPPPVYVGFGSVISRDLRRLTRVAVEALAISRQRGVLLSGWGGLGAARDWPAGQMKNVYVLDSVPFDWLFARVTAAVHHGGVGTTAYALRAGIPSAFAPFAADQPFWARRLHALGASPAPVAPQNLTAARLARAITLAVEDEAMRAQARALGERIRAEDGVGAAVRLIESYLIFS